MFIRLIRLLLPALLQFIVHPIFFSHDHPFKYSPQVETFPHSIIILIDCPPTLNQECTNPANELVCSSCRMWRTNAKPQQIRRYGGNLLLHVDRSFGDPGGLMLLAVEMAEIRTTGDGQSFTCSAALLALFLILTHIMEELVALEVVESQGRN